MSWKILITARTFDVVGSTATDRLRSAGCEVLRATVAGPLDEAALLQQLPGCDAVLASVDQYTARVLDSAAAANLKIISRWGVGYDTIDLGAATARGVVVAYTPGLLTETVADYAFALLLAAARRIHTAHRSMSQGQWAVAWGHDVAGKTLGIVGCGRIGCAVARRGRGFGMRLLGYDIRPSPEAERSGVQLVPLEELLAQSDFVSLHAALTPESRGLIGAPELRLMRPTSFLVNTGRGPLIDESSLVRALSEGWIAGAALDVYGLEPLAIDHPLRRAPNVLLSPHQSSFSYEAGNRVSETAAQAIIDLQQGRPPEFVLNPDVLASPQLRARRTSPPALAQPPASPDRSNAAPRSS
jgi:phosphoglycerate dehydrogenase-like enzyme